MLCFLLFKNKFKQKRTKDKEDKEDKEDKDMLYMNYE